MNIHLSLRAKVHRETASSRRMSQNWTRTKSSFNLINKNLIFTYWRIGIEFNSIEGSTSFASMIREMLLARKKMVRPSRAGMKS